MMNIKELKEQDKYRFVVYTDGSGEQKKGYITSWNDKFVFVNYLNGETSNATSPRDLTFLVQNPFKQNDKLAMQNRCVHCHREQYAMRVMKISQGLCECTWCGEMTRPMTNDEYENKYNHGRKKTV